MGCGASANDKSSKAKQYQEVSGNANAATARTAQPERLSGHGNANAGTEAVSYRKKKAAASSTDTAVSGVPVASATPPPSASVAWGTSKDSRGHPAAEVGVPIDACSGAPVPSSGSWHVEDVDTDLRSTETTAADAPACAIAQDEHAGATCTDDEWWSYHADWVQKKARDMIAAYNFFFEHIGLKKGWRVAPFQRAEVQAPFESAAQVVILVRAKLDHERGEGLVLRQLEGSSMSFLWGWDPTRPPGESREAAEDFFRGLVIATLSDGHGLVEGLDAETVESFIVCHPFLSPEDS